MIRTSGALGATERAQAEASDPAVSAWVGANAGAYALLFGQWVGPAGKVCAFEPSPPMRQQLARHVRLNGLEQVIEVVPVAAADRNGEAEFTLAPPDGMHRLLPNQSCEGSLRVPVVTLDSFCADRGPMDIPCAAARRAYEIYNFRSQGRENHLCLYRAGCVPEKQR